jgi:hypothetical protein
MISLELNDKVVSKKVHPCGSSEWTVVRTGADYKFKCNGCGRIVMIDSAAVAKFVKKKVENV